MSIKNILRTGLLASAAMIAVAGPADAAIKAFSSLQFTNLSIVLTPPPAQGPTVNIGLTSSTSVSNLNGSGISTTDNTWGGALNNIVDNTASFTGAAGANGAPLPGTGNNVYANYTNGGGSSFGYADGYLETIATVGGGTLSNGNRNVSGTLDLATKGTSRTTAQNLLSDSFDGEDAHTAIQETTTFTLSQNVTMVQISFDYDVLVGGIITAGDDGSAQASGDFIITLRDSTANLLVTQFNFGKDFLGQDLSINADTVNPNLQIAFAGSTGLISFLGNGSSDVLVTGHQYTLNIVQHSDTIVDRVQTPEPISVGLFGMGLVGLGALRRRKA